MDLVTGATGIVGREIVAALLSAGGKVRALRRERSDVEGVEKMLGRRGVSLEKLIWVEGDARDVYAMMDAVEGCSRVYHTAAVISFRERDAELLFDVNVSGTAAVVNAMLEVGVKELVYVSSVAALDGAEIPEKADYAVSKYKAELEVWRGGEEGLEVCMVRPTIILGEGDFSKSSGKLFLQVDKGLPVYPVGANGFVASKDVASACLAIAEAGLWGKAFVLNGANMKFKDAFEKIAASIGAKAPARPLKRWMSNLVCALPFVQNKIGLKAMQEDTVYDGSKVVEAIDGWSYSDIDEVIKEVGKVYLAG
jgi:nucleoside-diphosphate-sugar epimerase